MSSNPLLEARHLVKYFSTGAGIVHAVEDVNLSLEKGETIGVVGESGCGKTTLGRCILNLIQPTSGDVLFEGQSVLTAKGAKKKEFIQKMQIIFQDPFSSLDPRNTVSEIIAEPLIINQLCQDKKERDERISAMMETVGLAERLAYAYPHELDGGRRQRIGVARALVMKPDFIVCDEPVSALDVSIQAQILNLMKQIQENLGVAYMFITHDLSVVKHISHKIMVMYLGECIESAPKTELFENPVHPYTRALLSAVPIPDPKRRNIERHIIKGEVSSPINPKPGCRFAIRCPFTSDECLEPVPVVEVSPGHTVKCCKCGII